MLYRGRIAPSPTGLLHIGHASTFYTAWKRARDRQGRLVYRNEDLDPLRCKDQYADYAMMDLRQLGLDWDEGPAHKALSLKPAGQFGPYNQSQRLDLYHRAWQQLAASGHVYPCPHSRAVIRRQILQDQLQNKTYPAIPDVPETPSETIIASEPVYPPALRPLKYLPDLPAHPGQQNWRLRVDYGSVIEFNDLKQGPQRFVAGRDFGDFLVWRKNGWPSYEFAVVVDDAAMQISEVVRGADLLLSTARQILLYQILQYDIPDFYHCHLVLDEKGNRLAKQQNSLALRQIFETLPPAAVLEGIRSHIPFRPPGRPPQG